MRGILSGVLQAFIIPNFVKEAGINTLPTAIFGSLKRGHNPDIGAISTMLLVLFIDMVTLSCLITKSDTCDFNDGMLASLKAGGMGTYAVAVPRDYMVDLMAGEGPLDSVADSELASKGNVAPE